MSKISVIVPIYNVEDYLEEAIESLINQTIFFDLEVLLIDDGSEDGSTEIAEAYALRYPNISYHLKENGGLSDARNYGLQFVTSKYTMFLDSDDMYTHRACETLYDFAEEKELSIVVGNLVTFPMKTPNYEWKKYYGNGNIIIDLSVGGEELIKNPSACNKIFRTDILLDKKELFPVGRHFEDAFSIIPLMVAEQKIGVVDEVIYLYRQREDGTSIMNSVFKKEQNYYDYIELIKLLHEKILKNQEVYQIKYAVEKFIYKTFHGYLNNIILKQYVDFDEEERKWLFKEIQPVYKDMSFKVLEKLSKHRALKIAYYALVTNNEALFVNPKLKVGRIIIRDGIIVSSEYADVQEINTVHLYVSMERMIEREFGIELIGELLSNNAVIDHQLENSLILELTPKRGRKIQLPVYKFNKLDSPYIVQESDSICGVKVNIPKSLINRNENEYTVGIKLIEDATQERRQVITQAHHLFHRFKGKVDDKLSIDVLPNHTIKIIANPTWKEKLAKEKERIFDKSKIRVGGGLRLMHHAAHQVLKHKKIVLVGERPDTFQDNSASFFKYVNAQYNKRKQYYYLADKQSEAYSEAAQYGKVVRKDSIRHYLYLLSADTLVNSYDPDSYMRPSAYTKPEYYRIFGDLINYKRVFLQHGVTYNNVVQAISNYRIGFEGIVVTNKAEETLLKNNAYYNDHQLIRSGFPRYKKLKENISSNEPIQFNDEEERVILLMPTWRKDLTSGSYNKTSDDDKQDPTKFLASDYYEFYNNLLNNEELIKAIEEKNIKLKFFPHYEMRDFLEYFDQPESDKIEIVPKEQNVQDLLIECDMLITDYSSVFFDVLFMKKPVIFTQFDLEEFYKKHYKKGYLDFTKNELGKSVSTIEDTVSEVKENIANGFTVPDDVLKHIEYYLEYAYEEGNNRKIFEFIEEL
ncbi:bifunctional glycosyltransferase/CDP-glycerol:glycerophosphate glycerophosphotransferase [Staphylococcus muscae]|uniref:Galactosamine-containing minor teichoic acid biosynthesis protein n=3 Tax=Staphylococcus muscae TaxID=1294 RepID=A0A240BX99_9STAP|nr:CDP-glycerol glycerophosphotransferase family protein [Staphylococcus muscae]GGA84408.1 minor teichoic acid biosynthesis protein GgaB [Staphylococcus muscae]SNW00119.1 galactosamine-containing minor teichoic acid biosynthesis protein [Staphylococcus muscae]